MARLLQQYNETVMPALMTEFGLTNKLSVPRIKKVVVSMGVGRATQERKRLEDAVRDLTNIAGQKAKVTKAKMSVSNFKLRQGQEIGCMVTLRGARMYEFLDRFMNIAMPRIRDFRGVGRKFDAAGNYSVGVQDISIFPEVNIDQMEFAQGLNVTFVVANSDGARSQRMFELFGMPFRR